MSWEASKEVKDKIITELKAGKKIQEISKPRNITTPSNIYPPQLVKYFQLGDLQFAIVNVLSGLTLGGWDEKTTTSSGIWYVDKDDITWKPLITLAHTEGFNPHNNIFYFWNTGNRISLFMTDSYGGGSGEGNGKVVSSVDGGATWHIDRCFYFVMGGADSSPTSSVVLSTKQYLFQNYINRKPNKNAEWEKRDYDFNSSTGKFELTLLDPHQNKKITNEVDACSNISSP